MKSDGIGAIARFLGHMFGGIVVYGTLAVAATAIDNFAVLLKGFGASDFTLLAMTYLSHLTMVLDSLLVGFWAIVTTVRFGKDLYTEGRK